MRQTVQFSHPEPQGRSSSVWPVFLPFGGCSGKCIYCAQDLQTGTAERDLAEIHSDLRQRLEITLPSKKTPPEMGFYGGTFTCLPRMWQQRFLSLADEYKQRGLLTRIRCSTRPDAVTPDLLGELKRMGLDMVELGIQSLDDEVLRASRREYSPDTARRGCGTVRDQGLELGIQLMPGLPGQTPSGWLEEAFEISRLRPHSVRIYPCLVLEGTPLAELWKSGAYRPWDTERAIRAISRATLRLWRSDIPVIRIGLPPERDLLPHILAGPWHSALGSLVRSRVLFYLLLGHSHGRDQSPIRGLDCPQKYQGELWGHRGANRRRLRNLGLSSQCVRYTDRSEFTLYLGH